jgi:hypothetical protein
MTFLVLNQKLNVLHHMDNLLLINIFRDIARVLSEITMLSKIDPVLLLETVEIIIIVKGVELS